MTKYIREAFCLFAFHLLGDPEKKCPYCYPNK
jgi:hypothetical protein